MRRLPAALLLPALLAGACATGGGVDPALVEAGRRARRAQAPPTAPELRLEVDSFLANELPLMREKADAAIRKETRLWRASFTGGLALGVLAATSGTVADAGSGTKAALVGLGAATAIGSGVALAVRTPELRACRTFLDGAGRDVASWRREAIPPGPGPVTTGLWHAWIDRVAAIRSHPSCRFLR